MGWVAFDRSTNFTFRMGVNFHRSNPRQTWGLWVRKTEGELVCSSAHRAYGYQGSTPLALTQ